MRLAFQSEDERWRKGLSSCMETLGDVSVYHCQPSSRHLSPLSSCFKSTSIHPKVKFIMTRKCLLITAPDPSSVSWPQECWPAVKGGNQCSLTRTLQLQEQRYGKALFKPNKVATSLKKQNLDIVLTVYLKRNRKHQTRLWSSKNVWWIQHVIIFL